MSEQTATPERIGTKKSVSALWHGLLRQLSYEQRETWRQKGFPSDPYSTEPCAFCDIVRRDRARIELRAKERLAKAEQIAQDALAKAGQIRQEALRTTGANAGKTKESDVVALVRAVMQNMPSPPDVKIDLPPMPPINLNFPDSLNVRLHEDARPDLLVESSPDGRQTQIRRVRPAAKSADWEAVLDQFEDGATYKFDANASQFEQV